jgi:RpiB/LacA/LacB family sugar-phosphate isomerase
MERIIIGADHAGFSLKEAVKPYLTDRNLVITDIGTHSDEPVDYPDIGIPVAAKVASGEFKRGILVCGSGIGMTVIANKYPGVRAVLCLDKETARLGRLHNDTNILVLAGRRTDADTAKTIIGTWLSTAFEGGRHQRRLDKITDEETKLYR